MNKGFTLLETLVAIAIMMVSIGSAFGLAPEGLVGARFARNQTTATYLAQEAVETARNMRDNAMFFAADTSNPGSWLSALSSCVEVSCTVDVKRSRISPCTSDCQPLDIVTSPTGQVSYTGHVRGTTVAGASPSVFTRELRLTPVTNSKVANLRSDAGADTEVIVTATVTWKEGIITKTTEVNERLFDWWTFTK